MQIHDLPNDAVFAAVTGQSVADVRRCKCGNIITNAKSAWCPSCRHKRTVAKMNRQCEAVDCTAPASHRHTKPDGRHGYLCKRCDTRRRRKGLAWHREN